MLDFTASKIIFKKTGTVVFHSDVPISSSLVTPETVFTIQAELIRLGYILDAESFSLLQTFPIEYPLFISSEIIPYIAEMKGVQRNYKPFYRNFPQQVMEMSSIDLFLNAVLHYWSNGTWEPIQDEVLRKLQPERIKLKEISFEPQSEYKKYCLDVFTEIVMSNGGISAEDRKALEILSREISFSDFEKLLELTPPFKENMCVLAVILMENGFTYAPKTATDLMRIVVYMSGGDITLSSLIRFKNFKRKDRKMILSMLDYIKNPEEDMWRHKSLWLRLGEKIHPGEYRKNYPMAYVAFQTIRNGIVRTFESKVQSAVSTGNVNEICNILKKRPGVFARKLDHLLRETKSVEVFDAFVSVIDKVSTPVLIQLYGHFKARLEVYENEVSSLVYIPGEKMKTHVLNRSLKSLPMITTEIFYQIFQEISRRNPDKTKSIYIDPSLSRIPVPYGMRNTAEGIESITRGSRFAVDDSKNTIRAYVHWYDKYGTIDVDLSAAVLDKDFNVMTEITYYNLRNRYLNACHSGDIRHRKGHNAEYIDFDIEELKQHNVKYVSFDVRNFNKGPLRDVPECVFGWMSREFPEGGEIFVPNTIEHAIKVASDSIACYCMVFDVDAMEFVWVDFPGDVHVLARNERELLKFKNVIQAVDTKMTLEELLACCYKDVVASPEEADIVFGPEYAYKQTEFLSKYMK